jgi:hypothetical protein
MKTVDSSSQVAAHLEVCPNCGVAKPNSDAFCRHCGQKHTRLSDGLGYFVADFLTSFLSLDGRAFRTIFTLFVRPGQAAADFLTGRRIRYLSSAQTYLVSGFVFFLLLGRWVEVPEIDEQLEWQIDGQPITLTPPSPDEFPPRTAPSPAAGNPADEAEGAERSLTIDLSTFASPSAGSPGPQELQEGRRPAEPVEDRVANDRPANFRSEASMDFYHEVRQVSINGQTLWISFAQFRQFATQSERSVNQFFLDQNVKINPWLVRTIKNAALLTTDFGIANYVNNSIALASQIALLLLPLLAVLLRLFHWRSCRTWLAAFIVSAHFHSTIYLLLGGMMCLNLGVSWVFLLGTVAFFYYWVATLRRVFQQSWLVILIKSILIIPLYLFGVSVAVLAATVATLFVN